MNRTRLLPGLVEVSVPRSGGDEPRNLKNVTRNPECSPLRRG